MNKIIERWKSEEPYNDSGHLIDDTIAEIERLQAAHDTAEAKNIELAIYYDAEKFLSNSLTAKLQAAELRAEQSEAVLAEFKALWAVANKRLHAAAEIAYQEQVVDTDMEDSWIGSGNEYFDKDDWISSWISGLKET